MEFMKAAMLIDAHGRKLAINPNFVSSIVEFESGEFCEIYMTGGECHSVQMGILEIMGKIDGGKMMRECNPYGNIDPKGRR